MSLDAIAAAATAQNALTARINAFMDTADADIATRQAAYDALIGNLTDFVSERMLFTATLDPDETSPSEVRGGTYNDLVTLVGHAPAGSTIVASIAEGKVYTLTQDVRLKNKQLLFFDGEDNGGTPGKLVFDSYEAVSYTYMWAIECDYAGSVLFRNVDLELPLALISSKPPNGSNAAVIARSSGAAIFSVCFDNVTVTSGDATFRTVYVHPGNSGTVCASDTTVDQVTLTSVSAGGTLAFSRNVLTLVNGGLERIGGVLGDNLLEG